MSVKSGVPLGWTSRSSAPPMCGVPYLPISSQGNKLGLCFPSGSNTTEPDIMTNHSVFTHVLSTGQTCLHTQAYLPKAQSDSRKTRFPPASIVSPHLFPVYSVPSRFHPPLHFGDQGCADGCLNDHSPRQICMYVGSRQICR